MLARTHTNFTVFNGHRTVQAKDFLAHALLLWLLQANFVHLLIILLSTSYLQLAAHRTLQPKHFLTYTLL